MSVSTDAERPFSFGEKGGMDVDAEGEMVGDEILSRRSDVERIEVVILPLHHIYLLFRDCRVCRPRLITINIIPDCICHLFRCDTEGARRAAVDGALEEVGEGVVGHVNGGVGEGFDEELWVPREFGAEAIRARASPFVQPGEDTFEAISGFRVVGVCFGEEPRDEDEVRSSRMQRTNGKGRTYFSVVARHEGSP